MAHRRNPFNRRADDTETVDFTNLFSTNNPHHSKPKRHNSRQSMRGSDPSLSDMNFNSQRHRSRHKRKHSSNHTSSHSKMHFPSQSQRAKSQSRKKHRRLLTGVIPSNGTQPRKRKQRSDHSNQQRREQTQPSSQKRNRKRSRSANVAQPQMDFSDLSFSNNNDSNSKLLRSNMDLGGIDGLDFVAETVNDEPYTDASATVGPGQAHLLLTPPPQPKKRRINYQNNSANQNRNKPMQPISPNSFAHIPRKNQYKEQRRQNHLQWTNNNNNGNVLNNQRHSHTQNNNGNSLLNTSFNCAVNQEIMPGITAAKVQNPSMIATVFGRNSVQRPGSLFIGMPSNTQNKYKKISQDIETKTKLDLLGQTQKRQTEKINTFIKSNKYSTKVLDRKVDKLEDRMEQNNDELKQHMFDSENRLEATMHNMTATMKTGFAAIGPSVKEMIVNSFRGFNGNGSNQERVKKAKKAKKKVKKLKGNAILRDDDVVDDCYDDIISDAISDEIKKNPCLWTSPNYFSKAVNNSSLRYSINAQIPYTLIPLYLKRASKNDQKFIECIENCELWKIIKSANINEFYGAELAQKLKDCSLFVFPKNREYGFCLLAQEQYVDSFRWNVNTTNDKMIRKYETEGYDRYCLGYDHKLGKFRDNSWCIEKDEIKRTDPASQMKYVGFFFTKLKADE